MWQNRLRFTSYKLKQAKEVSDELLKPEAKQIPVFDVIKNLAEAKLSKKKSMNFAKVDFILNKILNDKKNISLFTEIEEMFKFENPAAFEQGSME